MKLKILTLIAVAVIAVFATDASRSRVSAQISYTWVYNATNLYKNNAIVYEFSGLDINSTYTWEIWTVDMGTGLPLDRLATYAIDNATTATLSHGAPNTLVWPTAYTGPIYVIDNFGQTLGKHFILEPPWENDGTDSWNTSGGAFTYQEKQVIGNMRDNSDGICKNPVHNPINVNGHHHGFRACQSTTTKGDIAILHIQLDPIGYVAPVGDTILLDSLHINNVTFGGNFDLDEWIVYQTDPTYSAYPTFSAFDSFVIINTGTQDLPYIDYARADTAFGDASLFNPMRWGQDPSTINGVGLPGAFGCHRIRAAVVQSDCESIWLVSNDPSPDSTSHAEWVISTRDPVAEAGTQVVTFRQHTEEIWDLYHGAYNAFESYSGYVNTTIYAYDEFRQDSYTVNNTAADGILLAWVITPTIVSFHNIDIIPADMIFITEDVFDISNVVNLSETIEQVISNFGLATELGRILLLGAILMVGLITTAFIPGVQKMPVGYLVMWTLFGGFWVAGGFAGELLDIGPLLYTTATIFLWISAFTIFKDSLFQVGGNDSETAA